MSILIKGIDMPTTCGNCWFCHAVSNEKWHCRLIGKSFASYSVGWGNENNTGENGQHPYIRRDDCPLVPVPPHGRLIDADSLYEKFARLESEAMNALKTVNTGSVNWIKWSAILTERTCYKHDIADAPTIIPASEEGEA